MALKDLFDLLTLALPADVEPTELRKCSPEALWRENPEAAAEQALRACSRINWDAYLANNPDVRQDGVDAWVHFLHHGLFEGRKLVCRPPDRLARKAETPAISLVIANYNNACTLRKCVESAIHQTLNDIEIIVVDDASKDDSPAIIDALAAGDARITVIKNSVNQGSFEARRAGVRAACGDFVMFLDSDDFLPPDACAIAWREAAKGYDIVVGGANIISGAADAHRAASLSNVVNKPNSKLYSPSELLNAVFNSNELTWTLWGKIFTRELCLKAFEELESGYFIMGEDGYAMLALCRHARNLKRIPQKIYSYSFGSGLSTARGKQTLYDRIIKWDAIKVMGEYASRHDLAIDFEKINKKRCRDAIVLWLESAPDNDAKRCLDMIKNLYGFETFMDALIDNYEQTRTLVASKFQHCVEVDPERAPAKRIGIFYHRLSIGGVEAIITGLAERLLAEGHEVTVFLEEKTDFMVRIPDGVDLAYLTSGFGPAQNIKNHLKDMEAEIQERPIDLMLYMAAYAPYTLWDLILLDHYNIPAIVANHGSFVMPFIKIKGQYSHHAQEAVFRCAAAVICLSAPGELYLRLHGVNAWHVANPVNPGGTPREPRVPRHAIAVMGRLGDPLKQTGDCLRTLKVLCRDYPQTKMLLIGDFDNSAQREEFQAKIRELGIDENIRLTGWTDKPAEFLRRCDLLFSTSYCESFGLAIAEAQAEGLPCVIYDLPIEQAEDNESIVRVPQGDYEAAAKAIASLFENPDSLRRLSQIARAKSARFAPESFYARMKDIMDNFGRYSPWRPYAPREYADLINYSAFYAGHKKPEKWY